MTRVRHSENGTSNATLAVRSDDEIGSSSDEVGISMVAPSDSDGGTTSSSDDDEDVRQDTLGLPTVFGQYIQDDDIVVQDIAPNSLIEASWQA